MTTCFVGGVTTFLLGSVTTCFVGGVTTFLLGSVTTCFVGERDNVFCWGA